MLFTKTAKVKWNPSNRDWYLSKGYTYTSWHEEIEVKIEDLAKRSPYKLDFKCDYCNKNFSRPFANYSLIQDKNKTGKDACQKCLLVQHRQNKSLMFSEVRNKNNIGKIVAVKVEDEIIELKKCETCLLYKELGSYIHSTYPKNCSECDKEYKSVNKLKLKLKYAKDITNLTGLRNDLTEEQVRYIIENFNDKCALTGDEDYILEHFIPLSWGHGGTYLGNIYPLVETLNISKSNRNPFDWFSRQKKRKELSKSKWGEVIKFLADCNDMNVTEFKKFVNWCYKNKRTEDEMNYNSEKTSVELWRESVKIK